MIWRQRASGRRKVLLALQPDGLLGLWVPASPASNRLFLAVTMTSGEANSSLGGASFWLRCSWEFCTGDIWMKKTISHGGVLTTCSGLKLDGLRSMFACNFVSQRKIICFLLLWSKAVSHSVEKRLRCSDRTRCKTCTYDVTRQVAAVFRDDVIATPPLHVRDILIGSFLKKKIKAPQGDTSRLFPPSPAGSERLQPGVTEWVWTRPHTRGADVYKCVNTNPCACAHTHTSRQLCAIVLFTWWRHFGEVGSF